MTAENDAYLPISAYGAIGNMRTVALVGRNGSIDWSCFPELGGASVFAAILDRRRGGRFRASPRGHATSAQRYRGSSWVLETRFEVEGGQLLLTDFMPLRSGIVGVAEPETEPAIYRVLRCEGGEVDVEIEWSPRFGYARERTQIQPIRGGFHAIGETEGMVLSGLRSEEARLVDRDGPVVEGSVRLTAGEYRVLVARYLPEEHDSRGISEVAESSPREAAELLRMTCDAWVRWAHDNEERPTEDWAGEWSQLVTRSELVLKLLSHPWTGAIAAAPTTSLPECIGGVRNWDYRYCWIRDGALVIQALHALGHSSEAHRFLDFLESGVSRDPSHGLQIMYGLHGETDLEEVELEHLEGYRGSRPVRIGNAAAGQRQHDTYGELLDAAYELVRRGEELKPEARGFLARIADAACNAWREPDSGVWEMRAAEQHFVHSKVMIWVALDRAVRLAEETGMEGDVEKWRSARHALRSLILRKGYGERLGAFRQTFTTDDVDAASLRFAIEEFLPADDPRMRGTIDAVLERLTEQGLVYRYLTADGLPGGEAAFCVCTFWLVDALTLAGRIDEALEIYGGIISRTNHVGLLSEQIDPRSGEFLGNFPQAYSHLGLINSALYLSEALDRPVPRRASLLGERTAEQST